jgi:hypothetical protein
MRFVFVRSTCVTSPAPSLDVMSQPLRRSLLSSALALAIGSTALPALAQQRDDGRQERRDQRNGDNNQRHNHDRELSDAVRRIEREQRGQVLSAERVQYEGREMNRIKVVDDQGRVRVYMDDPHAGDTPPSPP